MTSPRRYFSTGTIDIFFYCNREQLVIAERYFPAGCEISACHPTLDEFDYIISGELDFIYESECKTVCSGESISLEADHAHRIVCSLKSDARVLPVTHRSCLLAK